MTIGYHNTINIDVTSTPQGGEQRNTNSLAIFTNEQVNFSEPYRYYSNSLDAAQDLGTNSLTNRMLNTIFSQSPNVRTGGGVVYVFPFTGVNATSGGYSTDTLTFESFKPINNGVLTIITDGNEKILQNLNFTACNNLTQVAQIISNKNPDCNISVVDNQIQIISRRYGEESTITLQATSTAETDVFNYLKAGEVSFGSDATHGTYLTPTITGSFTGITNATLVVQIDNEESTHTGLDFSSASTLEEVATYLQSELTGVTITVVNDALLFTSDEIGFGSNVNIIEIGSDNALFTLIGNGTATNGQNVANTTYITPPVNVNSIKLISNGKLTITMDGNTQTLTDLDFTNVDDVEGIVAIINEKSPIALVEADTNYIKFVSTTAGAGGTVNIESSEISGIEGIDIFPLLEGGTEIEGSNSSGQKLSDAVIEGLDETYFGGVLSTQYCENEAIEANANALASLELTYYDVMQSLDNIPVLGNAITSANLNKTRLSAYSLGNDQSKLEIAGYASIAKSVNYRGANTANTLNLKTINGIAADTNLNQNYYNIAKENGVDIYGATGGLSVVYSFGANDYTDNVENKLWLASQLEINGFNSLRQTFTKLPQTEEGLDSLKNAYIQALEQGVRNGVIAPGTWNGQVPFGDTEDFLRNIEERGYYIYSIPISQQDQSEREQRKAPLIQIAVKFAGAIHSSDVIVYVQY